jgi:hypothetical protein
MYIEGKLCRKCQKELGRGRSVLIQDKITKGLHSFHYECQPIDPNVQRHHFMFAEPGQLGMKGRNLGSV